MHTPGANTYWRIEPETNIATLKEEARKANYLIKPSAYRDEAIASYKRFRQGKTAWSVARNSRILTTYRLLELRLLLS